MEDKQSHKIGEPFDGPAPAVFELVISDHVTWANPDDYGVKCASVNPADYFVTSGDAVEKAKVLDHDLWQLAGTLRKELYQRVADEQGCDNNKAQELFRNGVKPAGRFHEYEAAVWKAAGQSRKLINALKAAKGVNCFLETEWDCHRLLCIPKNPRR